jgi:hypothetical protein
LSDKLYAGIFRALLTEEALDRAGRLKSRAFEGDLEEIEKLIAVESLDEVYVQNAKRMSVVYTAIAAFENSVRDIISKTMLENVGADWWQTKVSEKIKKAAEERKLAEEKVKWHTQRGEDPIQFTMLPNLLSILRQNSDIFQDLINDMEWAAAIFETIERSRNVIMHSGTLTNRDIARLGSLFRDWNAQVSV